MHSSKEIISQSLVSNAYMARVYRYMMLGLFLTGLISYLVAPFILYLIDVSFKFLYVLFGISIAQIVLVLYITRKISTFSASKATGLFLLYSALNGLTLAPIFIVYTEGSIFGTFLICSGMFGAMSLYGTITKKDLTSLGSFCIMGLIGILLASFVNIFLRSSMLESIISYFGVITFLGLTAYDVQKLRHFGEDMPVNNPDVAQRGIILGALTLYLDFLNLLIYLLRIMGKKNN